MPRAVAHHIPREMAVLGLIEFMLSFAVIYTVIQTTGTTTTVLSPIEMLPRDGAAVAAVLALISGGVALTIGLYRPEICLDRKRLLIAIGIAATIAFALLLSGELGKNFTSGRAVDMAKVVAAWLVSIAVVRLSYSFVVNRMSLARRVLLIGSPRQVGELSVRLRPRHGRVFDLVVLHDQSISWQLLREKGIWGIVVATEPEGQAIESLVDCKLRGVPVLSGAAFQENYLGRIDLDTITANALLLSRGFTASKISAGLKRLCDIVVSTCMLVLLLPVMALTAMAIKIDSTGPVFYRQRRVGQFDKPFTLFKFRSMITNAEASGSPRWAQQQDPRITRVGRFIRATRIDELPQLANIMRGQMTLVGPRPERPHFVEQLARAIPFYRQRAYVKPGLTGWAQVNFPYGASVEDAREKLAYDLYYVKNRTIMLDMVILLSTIRVVLFHEGAR
jgi:exopolysaccharide biosynthesis polyprenyl glycosylphosphotransferase